MPLRWTFAALHLLALGMGLGAVWARARALRALARDAGAPGVPRDPRDPGDPPDHPRDPRDPRRDRPAGHTLAAVFSADAWWILALGLWLVTGLVRAIAGLEKPGAFYVHSRLFWTKMGVFTIIFVAELWPMTTILQWGLWRGKGRPVEYGAASRLAAISYVQAVLVVVAVGLAVGLAR
ncbi:MAG: DUF2214 family protein [Gemmatimonadota bacterium]